MAKGSGGTRTNGNNRISVNFLVDDYLYKHLNYDDLNYNNIYKIAEDKANSNSDYLVVNVRADYRSKEYPDEPEYIDYKLKIDRKTKKVTELS